jgi:glycogen phosphorylase
VSENIAGLVDVDSPLFYTDRDGWVRIMRQCTALNGSIFNTHRMARQYVLHAYSLGKEP